MTSNKTLCRRPGFYWRSPNIGIFEGRLAGNCRYLSVNSSLFTLPRDCRRLRPSRTGGRCRISPRVSSTSFRTYTGPYVFRDGKTLFPASIGLVLMGFQSSLLRSRCASQLRWEGMIPAISSTASRRQRVGRHETCGAPPSSKVECRIRSRLWPFRP